MKTIELIYDHDCPNVELTRTRLRQAFTETGIPTEWIEWERGDTSAPSYVRDYGSPTVLVDKKDVAGMEPSEGVSSCRLYTNADGGFTGAPSVDMIATALNRAADSPTPESGESKPTGWRTSLAVLPGIGAALLPVGTCPACWPVYAGLLSSLGFGFLFETVYIIPITALFLIVAVAALAYKASTRRGFRPFILGLAASATVLIGKFVFGSDIAMYVGIAMLIAASLWNAWPVRRMGTDVNACPACVPTVHTS